jgi:LCP family protein required for cell wall assembly
MWWTRGAIALVLAWLVFLVAVPIWAWSSISKVNAVPGGKRPPDTAGTTYLLVGSDSRAGLTKAQEADLGTGSAAGQRTDTIILLDVPASGPTLLLSIPRDSFLHIPGHGENKINAAYSIGGPRLLVHTVEKATKVRIDNYVEIGFAGFVDVVDAVGGIQVCPKTPINDPKAGHLHMRKGCQHIDGHTALGYSRSRAFPNGDITRALHQREVIGAVGSAAASWKTVVLPWRYFNVNSAAAKTVQVGKDVGPIDLMRFAWAMAHVGGGNTKRCVVPYSNLGATTSAGSSVLWDQHRAHALFAAIRSGDTSSVHCAPQ